MIATFPPMFVPKGTTREATAEAICIVVGFINRFSAFRLANTKAQGTGLSFFAVALVALDPCSRNDATFFRRAILASRNASIEEYQALANENGEGLVAHPSVFLG